MRKQFNLQDWLKDKSQKVETKDGRPVRIVCWDAKRKYGDCVCGFMGEEEDRPYFWQPNGSWWADHTQSQSDLFIVTPEEELTEFEKRIENLLNLALPEGHAGTTIENTKRVAAELLTVAEKEIIDRWSNGLRDTQDRSGKAYSDGYELGLEKGKAEVLKDLPRWKKAIGSCCVGKSIMFDEHGFYSADITKPGCRYITCDILAKLPGFND